MSQTQILALIGAVIAGLLCMWALMNGKTVPSDVAPQIVARREPPPRDPNARYRSVMTHNKNVLLQDVTRMGPYEMHVGYLELNGKPEIVAFELLNNGTTVMQSSNVDGAYSTFVHGKTLRKLKRNDEGMSWWGYNVEGKAPQIAVVLRNINDPNTNELKVYSLDPDRPRLVDRQFDVKVLDP